MIWRIFSQSGVYLYQESWKRLHRISYCPCPTIEYILYCHRKGSGRTGQKARGLTLGEVGTPSGLPQLVSKVAVTAWAPLNAVGDQPVLSEVNEGFGGKLKTLEFPRLSNILVKCSCIIKHLFHVPHICYIPKSNDFTECFPVVIKNILNGWTGTIRYSMQSFQDSWYKYTPLWLKIRHIIAKGPNIAVDRPPCNFVRASKFQRIVR
jgi:hypothetical protein